MCRVHLVVRLMDQYPTCIQHRKRFIGDSPRTQHRHGVSAHSTCLASRHFTPIYIDPLPYVLDFDPYYASGFGKDFEVQLFFLELPNFQPTRDGGSSLLYRAVIGGAL